MDGVNCPECGEIFGEEDVHWVTNAEGGVMYRLPCDHMAVGTWTDGEVTYGPEHLWTCPPATEHHHRYFHDQHRSFIDELDKILEEKLHEG
ncbi:hypothetical protein QGN32_08115 [Mycolicibacterium sp. ND9-15]|uniref:hypothetical protein n=1 Tax=Mycolicibacterium sp. ND9-15 TaxID=3042320 RepID=UPI002DDA3758|nr:hypothetical protein [Mycolicibacterium sp. ND9-15]WSE57810.1 hypothetical protein QGN32_08115 [Mycolicibacterium sp. ND9-15]